MRSHSAPLTTCRLVEAAPVFVVGRWTARVHVLTGLLVFSVSSWCASPPKYHVDYILDDSTPEWSIGRGGVGDLWIANAFTVQDGGEVIVSIEASFWQAQGVPLGVHLYDDPNDDGIPNDLIPLHSLQTVVPPFGACHEFPITPTQVSGVFFVALSYPDSWGDPPNYEPFVLDDSTDEGKTWYLETSAAGSLDPANLQSPLIDLTSVAAAKLGFWYIGDFGDNIGNDYCKVEILNTDTTVLLEDRISGLSTWFWKYREIPFPPTAFGAPIYVRFTLHDYNDGNVGRGAYIDDVRIVSVPWPDLIRNAGLDDTSPLVHYGNSHGGSPRSAIDGRLGAFSGPADSRSTGPLPPP